MRGLMVLLIVPIAACGGGGGGGGGSGIDPRLARVDVYEAQRVRVLGDPGAGVVGMAATETADVPITGAITYDGSVTISVETSVPIFLAGDAAITMDFAAGDVSGEMRNMFGRREGQALQDYAGTLVIADGTVDDANGWSVDYAGTLESGSDTLVFAGQVVGSLYGAEAEAIAGAEFGALIDVNGDIVDGSLTIVAEEEGGASDVD
ncbi:hypothetical protein [Yoonia sp. 2307UL14-13]|uniref:hypothetical protein n=1 Tax=Yoonia sp. 2307UL14-13 TaxID=3126506 RepID=UPI0030ACBB9D